MYRFFSFLFLFFSFLSPITSFAACTLGEIDSLTDINVATELERCKPQYGVTLGDAKINGGAKERIVTFANRLILLTSGLAVLGIVIGGFRYVTSFGEEEKSKKAKDSIKYALIGFAVTLISFPLVNGIIDFIYKVTGS